MCVPHADPNREQARRISSHAVAAVLTTALALLDDAVIPAKLAEAFFAAASASAPADLRVRHALAAAVCAFSADTLFRHGHANAACSLPQR